MKEIIQTQNYMQNNNQNEQLQRIREMMEIPSDDLGEGEFTKVATTLHGLRPAIKTIAIITAENPMGQEADPEFNKEANDKLRRNLLSGQFGYRQIKGKYGSLENPFLINNISRSAAIALGANYNQESIVFGEVESGEDSVGMRFEQVSTKNDKSKGETLGVKRIFVMLDNTEVYNSESQGRGFLIPFYDVYDVIEKLGEMLDRFRNCSNTERMDGVNNPPTSPTPPTSMLDKQSIEEELMRIVEKMSSTIGSTAYNYRGMYWHKLKEYGIL